MPGQKRYLPAGMKNGPTKVDGVLSKGKAMPFGKADKTAKAPAKGKK